MDNVVQNIRMEDIIPSDFHGNQEEQQKVEELAKLIKTFGLIDPILVRPRNGQYEIVLGIEKYQAAKLAGLNYIPAIIKEVDDETFSKYLNVDKKSLPQTNIKKDEPQNNKKTLSNNFTIPLEKSSENNNLSTDSWKIKNSNQNSDIINLSELSKEEYERDDFKMNNEQFNNNIMNNNFEQPQAMQQSIQGPTFGGRFFPSLEDEPTNMNMMGTVAPEPTIPELPNMNNNINNNTNLIDLTDLSMDKEPNIPSTPDFAIPNMNTPVPEMNQPMNNIEITQTDFEISNPMKPQEPNIPVTDTIINLESLQNSNPAVRPIVEPTPMTPINNDFGAQTSMQPQFDIPQNMAPQMPYAPEMNQPMNSIEIPSMNIGMNNSTMMAQPEVQPMSKDFVSAPTEPISMDILNADFGAPTSIVTTPPLASIPTEPSPMSISAEPTVPSSKDVTPVTNTIKNLVSSLEAFGYKITINEEDLATSVKLTIEVEK